MRLPIIVLSIMCVCTMTSAQWESIGPYGGYLYSVAASPSDSGVVWVMTYSTPAKIARSTDGGASWSTIGTLSEGYVQWMTADAIDANRLYAVGGSYTHRSTDGGANWTSTYLTNCVFWGMAVHPTQTGVIFGAGTKFESGLVKMSMHKSTNGGKDWSSTVLYDGATASFARGMAIASSDPDVIYVCGHTFDVEIYPLVFKSTDGGATFEDVTANLPTGFYLYTIGVHPTNPDIVYLGAATGIYRSTDGGGTWTYQHDANTNYSIITTPLDADLVYCGAYYSVYKSTDAGATWTDCGTGLEGYDWRGIAINQHDPAVVYTGNRVGFFKTTDAGANWFEYNNDLNLVSIYNFALSPIATPLLYTSCEEVGVFKTTDHGTSWTKLPTPVTCGNICEFAINPENPDVILGLEGMG